MDYDDYQDVPIELRRRMRFVAAVTAPEKAGYSAYCESYWFDANGSTRLVNVMSDTSDCYQGVLLKKRVSHNVFIDFSASYQISVRPLEADELARLQSPPALEGRVAIAEAHS